MLLLEIDQFNPKRLNKDDNFGTYFVTLKDLEIFKQWSIWKGNVATGKVFDFGDEIKEEKFEFNLETTPAYSIVLGSGDGLVLSPYCGLECGLTHES